MRGKLVLIDGIDGSGKSTVMQEIIDHLNIVGKKIFDIRDYGRANNKIPEFSDIPDYDIYISSEPSYGKIGREIKEELLKPKRNYSGYTISNAFALDREILYKKLIIPALDAGKTVIQEKGITTTFIYQPVQMRIPLSSLMNLPGNKLAMKYAPNLVIILDIEPEVAAMRINNQDLIFDELTFKRKIAFRYKEEWFQKMFKVKYLNVNPPKTEEQIKNELASVLNSVL